MNATLEYPFAGLGSGAGSRPSEVATLVVDRRLRRVVSLLLGSGGEASSIVRGPQLLAGSGSSIAFQEIPDVSEEASLAEKLGTIKAAFGLSISQLAQVLCVQRPTVYAWMDAEAKAMQIRSAHKDRIESLYSHAFEWNRLSRLPAMPFVGNITVGGRDLIWHLTQERLDRSAVSQLIIALANRSAAEAGRRDAEPSLTTILKARGFSEAPRQTTARRSRP
jgi:hypothetical protein